MANLASIPPFETPPDISHGATGAHNARQHSGDMDIIWDMFIEITKRDIEEVLNRWKVGSRAIFSFVGIFCGINIVLIAKFLNNSDSDNQTRCAVAIWAIALILDLASAILATLLQEWARSYDESPPVSSELNHRALACWLLSLGMKRYGMRQATELCILILHISAFLTIVALSLVLHTFSKKVASAFDSFIGLLILGYTGLSAIPCLTLTKQLRTPLSYILWYPYHGSITLVSFGLHHFTGRFHGCIARLTSEGFATNLHRRLENAFKTHLKYFLDGLGNSVLKHALHLRGVGEREIVTTLFNLLALGNETKFQRFAANIPRDRVRELIPTIESERIILKVSLSVLLRSCVAGTRVAGRDDLKDMRKGALLVCLDAIYNIASMEPSIPDLDSVLETFANIDLMQELWADNDMAIRVTSRSICALLARHLVNEQVLDEPQLRWLQAIFGDASNTILDADISARELMNLRSFVHNIFHIQAGVLPTESVETFKRTLAVLLDARNNYGLVDVNFDMESSRVRCSEEIKQMVRQWYLNDARFTRVVVDTFYSLFPFLPNDLLPAVVLPAPPTSASHSIYSDLIPAVVLPAPPTSASHSIDSDLNHAVVLPASPTSASHSIDSDLNHAVVLPASPTSASHSIDSDPNPAVVLPASPTSASHSIDSDLLPTVVLPTPPQAHLAP